MAYLCVCLFGVVICCEGDALNAGLYVALPCQTNSAHPVSMRSVTVNAVGVLSNNNNNIGRKKKQ